MVLSNEFCKTLATLADLKILLIFLQTNLKTDDEWREGIFWSIEKVFGYH